MTINIEGHELVTHSSSRGDLIVKDAGCSCGIRYDWYTREEEHDAHALLVVANTPLREVLDRVKREAATLDDLLLVQVGKFWNKQEPEYIRLSGKLEGVNLVRSYIEEALR